MALERKNRENYLNHFWIWKWSNWFQFWFFAIFDDFIGIRYVPKIKINFSWALWTVLTKIVCPSMRDIRGSSVEPLQKYRTENKSNNEPFPDYLQRSSFFRTPFFSRFSFNFLNFNFSFCENWNFLKLFLKSRNEIVADPQINLAGSTCPLYNIKLWTRWLGFETRMWQTFFKDPVFILKRKYFYIG